MVVTIEPRLIAPFNESSWETYPRLDLPPLQYPDGLLLPSRPLILEPLAPRNTQQSGLAGLQNLDPYDGETAVSQYSFASAALINGPKPLSRPARVTSSQSLRKILADEAEPTQTPPRKRQRKDEFVKLPQPEKKQKGSQQVVQPLVPPIIVGIHEPPPNQASKFRPIVSGGPFRDSHGRNSLNTASDETRRPTKEHIRPRSPLQEVQPVVEAAPALEQAQDEPLVESTTRTVQARNKWTDEETKQLLLGVQKHGIGSWKRILEDKEFIFNNRKAVHIKDRFRTCFPDGCEGQVTGATPAGGRQLSGEMEKVMAYDGEVMYRPTPTVNATSTSPTHSTSTSAPSSSTPPKKSKSHRKDLSDLKEIGIVQPFSKSRRRQRRAFTEEEDRNILIGLKKHGQSNWTAIQRDTALGLDSRKPTDIRDRFRNRYPEKHKEIVVDDSKDEYVKGGLRTVVSIEELLDPDVGASSSSAPLQPQNQAQDQFLPPISFQSNYPDILSSTTRLPKMSFTEFLSGPLPAMDVPGDPFSFPDWTDATPFSNEDYWLPEIQQPQQTAGIGTGRQKQSVYDISTICEAVEPYGGQGLGA